MNIEKELDLLTKTIVFLFIGVIWFFGAYATYKLITADFNIRIEQTNAEYFIVEKADGTYFEFHSNNCTPQELELLGFIAKHKD